MNILLAGGTGFIGQALVKHFSPNHKITVLGRTEYKITTTFPGSSVNALTWDELEAKHIEQQDLIINLAGAAVADRTWSDKAKQIFLDSRIKTTKTLAKLCAASDKKPTLFNASAIGVYDLQDSQNQELPPAFDESTTINFNDEPNFLATLGRRWERAANVAAIAGVRVVNCRFGLVLGSNGGALKKLRIPFLLGLGGPIGDGMQPFTWVAIQDVVNVFDFLITHEKIAGPVNFVSPNAVTQKQFAKAFAKVLHRPAFFKTFAFVVKLVFGQMGEEALLRGQHVYPKVLIDHGFEFSYPALSDAIAANTP